MADPAGDRPTLKFLDCRFVHTNGTFVNVYVRLAFGSRSFGYINSFLRLTDPLLVRAFPTETDAQQPRDTGSSLLSMCEELAIDRCQAQAVLLADGYVFSDSGESVVVWLRTDKPLTTEVAMG